jgi:putative transposase
MPRPPRFIVPNIPVHIVQRGNNRRSCFRQSRDYRSYLAALRETSASYNVSIHAFVLMTNHIHILARPISEDAISRMMQQLGRKYVTYFNKEHGRTGTLWEGRFRSSAIYTERYLFACYRYIELNPVRAGLVQSVQDYAWSSYRSNAMGEPNGNVQPSPEWLALGKTVDDRSKRYRRLFADAVEDDDDQIRIAVRKGRALR